MNEAAGVQAIHSARAHAFMHRSHQQQIIFAEHAQHSKNSTCHPCKFTTSLMMRLAEAMVYLEHGPTPMDHTILTAHAYSVPRHPGCVQF